MSSKEYTPKELVVVFICDPLNIQYISIDNLQKVRQFDIAAKIPPGVILVDSKNNTEINIQTNRIEITNSQNLPFSDRNIVSFATDVIQALSDSCPTFSIKAVGLNLFAQCNLQNQNAAEWIADNFLKDKLKLEELLAEKVIGNSTRIFYGTPEQHHDLRFSPLQLTGYGLQIQQHFHEDIKLKIEEINIRLKQIQANEILHLENVFKKLITC